MNLDQFIILLKTFCTTQEEQKVIQDAYIRFLDQHRPQRPKTTCEINYTAILDNRNILNGDF